MSELLKNKNDYTTVAFFKDTSPYIPKNDAETKALDLLKSLKFKDHHIRILLEADSLPLSQLLLEIEEAKLKADLDHAIRPGKHLADVMRQKFGINFNQDTKTNTMKYVHDLKEYARWLDKNNISWTYINVYARRDRSKQLGRIYADQPIPKRIN